MPHLRSALLAWITTAACGDARGVSGFSDPTGPMASTHTASTSSTSTGGLESTSTSAKSTSASSTSGTRFDMAVPDLGEVPSIGCKGKIDFIFAISAAGTMSVAQEQLLESIPGFITALEEQVPDFDVHILVADPDSIWGMDDCTLCTTDCNHQASPPQCGAALHACDKQIGAGLTFPAGKGATNRRCKLAEGRRYITRDEPDRAEAFACMSQVGLEGGERTAEAMVNAVGSELNGPDGCNEGFLREDALLVVTIINDGYDQFSAGTVDSWITALRAAKQGDDDAFAVLALTTDIDVSPWELCLPGEYSPNKNPLRALTEGVEHGFVGSICQKNFAPFFVEAVDSIVSLCDGFVVPR